MRRRLKFARLSTGRWHRRGDARFHGRTMGSLSATWNKKYREAFEPLVPGFRHVSYNNIEALEGAVTDSTAAVLLEWYRARAVCIPAEPGLSTSCPPDLHRTGALLIDR